MTYWNHVLSSSALTADYIIIFNQLYCKNRTETSLWSVYSLCKWHCTNTAKQNESRSKQSINRPKHAWHKYDLIDSDVLFPLLLCLFSCFSEELCAEGRNLANTFRYRERGVNEEAVSFSQYPRPADTPQVPETVCLEKQIKMVSWAG